MTASKDLFKGSVRRASPHVAEFARIQTGGRLLLGSDVQNSIFAGTICPFGGVDSNGCFQGQWRELFGDQKVLLQPLLLVIDARSTHRPVPWFEAVASADDK